MADGGDDAAFAQEVRRAAEDARAWRACDVKAGAEKAATATQGMWTTPLATAAAAVAAATT